MFLKIKSLLRRFSSEKFVFGHHTYQQQYLPPYPWDTKLSFSFHKCLFIHPISKPLTSQNHHISLRILPLLYWVGACFRLDELSKEVWWYLGDQGHCGNHLQCSDKSQNSDFLRKSVFCVLGGPKNFFESPQNLIWP